MAKLTPSMKDHDRLDKIKLQEEIDSANNTLSSNKNVEGDDNIIGENQTEDVLSPNDINIGSSYSKSVRRSSHKFGSRLRFFRRTSAAVQGANLEDEELQASQKKQESTEITDSDNDDEGRSSIVTGRNVIGSLLKDTYSFIYVYPVCSAPTIYAVFLFLFQSLVYALLLSSLIDVNNPNNILHVPPSVSIQMRIAQGCAILIAVVNSVDIMVAMNNLLRVPTAIIVIDNNESQGLINTHGPSIHNATELSSIQHGIGHARSNISGTIQTSQSFKAGFKFKFANVMRLVEGVLSVASSFILIVRSDDVIEMFINFAALEFVVNLDNLAFALAEHGLISDRLQDAAIFVGGLGYTYPCHRGYDDNHRTKKKDRGGCSPSQLAHIKGSFIGRLFSSPARYVKNHPDYTRRTTLFIMAATLYGCWFLILAGLNNGQFLCKSLNVDFFHAHISVNTREQMEQGIKPFLASRSGLYVWIPQEDDKQSFLASFKNLFTGNVQYLAYRKIDKRVESPEHSLSEHAHGRIPFEYVDIVYYDSERSVWVFTSCSLDTYFLKEERNCIGPEVNSFETKSLDLIELSSSAAFHVKGNKRNNRFNTTMALPAIIQCNECGRQQDGSSIFSDIVTCGISGGVCSEPQEEFGFGRQCICPQGQYGALCDEYYGTSCKALEIIPLEGVNEFPLGAQTFYDFSYTLKENERGFGNTPVWVNEVEGYIDRVERREGLHWAITRQVSSEKDFYTIAIADAVSEMDAGAATSGLTSNPQPAGLTFYAPKTSAWGTQPDYSRPFSSYQLQCKSAM